MQEPNYCEAQLQQMTNTEMFNLLRSQGIFNSFPRIIPPHLEDLWGWDTGFFLPWLGLGHTSQLGCNLFIQYKLSNEYNGRRSQGWQVWQQSFFRFNLGYRRHRRWDFNQRNHLVMLSNQGYAVVYITNHVLDFNDLANLARQDQLCSSLPVLRVDRTISRHKRVSFTANSTQFSLHSNMEKASRVTITKVLSDIRTTTLDTDINTIIEILSHYEEATGFKEETLKQAITRLEGSALEYLRPYIVQSFLHKYLNVYWLRFLRRGHKSEE
jgi:hypothetical protein